MGVPPALMARALRTSKPEDWPCFSKVCGTISRQAGINLNPTDGSISPRITARSERSRFPVSAIVWCKER